MSISLACRGQLVKIILSLESYGIIWIKFCILIIIKFGPAMVYKNCENGLPTIILAVEVFS